jgi:hypothetical protein
VDIGEWSIVVKNAKERLPQLNKKIKDDPKNPIDEQISIQYSAWDFGGQVLTPPRPPPQRKKKNKKKKKKMMLVNVIFTH